MSYPGKNPDTRPLPDGWITQYDPSYQAWFYIDTRQNPPRSSWEHPLGPVPPANYVPPSGPPPSKSPNHSPLPQSYAQGWQDNRGTSPYSQPSPYQQPQQQYYPQQQQQQAPYGNANPTSRGKAGLLGKLFSGHSSHGSSHGGYGGGYGGGYAPQQQPVYVQGKPKRQGMGMGGVALGAGAGLLGGLLIEDAIHDYGEDRYEQGFEAGDDYGGGDFGGGDFGGGDF